MPSLTVDNINVHVPRSRPSILDAARQAGVRIPTLCYLKDVQAIGACRICLVEVQGARTLVASCATPVTEGMVVKTNTQRVRERPPDRHGTCCSRNMPATARPVCAAMIANSGAWPANWGSRKCDLRASRECGPSMTALLRLFRDPGKCIMCRRCVTVCGSIQGVCCLFPQNRGFKTTIGPAFAEPLGDVVCVQCGQCAAVCPVGAIVEKDEMDTVLAALEDPSKHVIVQTAPAIRAALGECFGYPPGTLVTGKMVSALRRLGFDAVFDTNFAADLTIMEEANELLARLKEALVDGKNVALPMFTSCSPGWIKYMEHLSSRHAGTSFHLQVASADVRRRRQDLLCRADREAS